MALSGVQIDGRVAVPTPIVDQVIDLYEAPFERIFAAPFPPQIPDRLKRNIVGRQVQECH